VCTLDIAETLLPAYVDEGQIIQVINNLIINATQAMSPGGSIAVHADNVTVDDTNGEQFFPLQPGTYVAIIIKDQGVGIPEEHRKKIFDPYFTTKEQGSGLGLFTSYAIIKKHDGHIALESEVGVGTTFSIYLPAARGHLATAADTAAIQTAGTGNVLIMDDEEGIRAVTGAMLRRCGYEVDFARNGQEAIAMYTKAHEMGQPFHVLIMDLTIPGGMGGQEALRHILRHDPQARAIVVSGYSNDPIMAQFDRYGFRGCLVKPYKFQDLIRVLQQVMGTSETAP
jgi:CheY-like chemotaxis protein